MSQADVLMLVLNPVIYDSRVREEAAALAAEGWRVLVIGTQRASDPYPEHESLRGFTIRRVRYRRYGAGQWWPWRWIRHGLQALAVIAAVRGTPARIYHAHDLPALLLVTLARGWRRAAGQDPGRMIYDAHELYLFQTPRASRLGRAWDRLWRPLGMAVEGALARRAERVITVPEERARLLARWYRLRPPPTVILTALDPVSAYPPPPLDLRVLAGGRRVIVHTGYLHVHRLALNELVRALAFLPEDVALVLLGMGPEWAILQREAAQAGVAERVVLVPPVVPEAVPAVVCTADAAAVLMRAESWNSRTSLPNRLFHAIAAGVPVIVSQTGPLKRLLRRYGIGAICDARDPAAIAAAVRAVLTPEAQAQLRAGMAAAQRDLNREQEAQKLCALYREVLG